jgi:hypothetical protein
MVSKLFFFAYSAPFMFLSDHINLQSIFIVELLMFDGTFAYYPHEFYQVDYEVDEESRTTSGQTYTMHAVFSDLPERQSNFLCGKFHMSTLFNVDRRNCFLATQVSRNVRQIVHRVTCRIDCRIRRHWIPKDGDDGF